MLDLRCLLVGLGECIAGVLGWCGAGCLPFGASKLSAVRLCGLFPNALHRLCGRGNLQVRAFSDGLRRRGAQRTAGGGF